MSTRIRGYRLNKDGALVPTTKHLDVSTRLKQKNSKKIRVVNPNKITSFAASVASNSLGKVLNTAARRLGKPKETADG